MPPHVHSKPRELGVLPHSESPVTGWDADIESPVTDIGSTLGCAESLVTGHSRAHLPAQSGIFE